MRSLSATGIPLTKGGGGFHKLVWPNGISVHITCGLPIHLHYTIIKCWCDFAKVGMALATPAIPRSPPMPLTLLYLYLPYMFVNVTTL